MRYIIIMKIKLGILIVQDKKLYSTFKDVVTPYTHISEASRYILYTIILTFDGICMLS